MSTGARSLRTVPFRENYSSSGSSLLNEFYIPALSNAITYDRATGYFSSAILALAPVAFSEFVGRGGKMRMLCSPHLSEADAEAIVHVADSEQPTPLDVAATVEPVGANERRATLRARSRFRFGHLIQ